MFEGVKSHHRNLNQDSKCLLDSIHLNQEMLKLRVSFTNDRLTKKLKSENREKMLNISTINAEKAASNGQLGTFAILSLKNPRRNLYKILLRI